MNEEIKNFISDISDLWSDIISPIHKIANAVGITFDTIELKRVLDEVYEIMPYVDSTEVPDYALSLLDSLNLPPKPKYGLELSTAVVYYLKAYFYFYGKKENESAATCLMVVENIPEWKVIYGKQTLLEIKEEARKLKLRINEAD